MLDNSTSFLNLAMRMRQELKDRMRKRFLLSLAIHLITQTRRMKTRIIKTVNIRTLIKKKKNKKKKQKIEDKTKNVLEIKTGVEIIFLARIENNDSSNCQIFYAEL